nr:DUF503 domain-containing protein [Anaerolineae bacterium]
MVIGAAIIELQLPGVQSLKEKRSMLKGLTARLHKHFNISCGEVALHDAWQSASLGATVVSTSPVHADNVLENVVGWIEVNRPDIVVVGHSIEIIHFF